MSAGIVIFKAISEWQPKNFSGRTRLAFTSVRPAMMHCTFSQDTKCIQLSLYDTQIIWYATYITTKQEGYCLMSCLWAQKSVQLTSLVGSTHAFVVSAILNITLNTAQHGFFSSVCSENHHAQGLKRGRRVSTNWRQCSPNGICPSCGWAQNYFQIRNILMSTCLQGF